MGDVFDKIGADRLADEVDVLIRRKVIDTRSPAADALLDYREPPSSPRSDRMAKLEKRVEELELLNRIADRAVESVRDTIPKMQELHDRQIDEREVLLTEVERQMDVHLADAAKWTAAWFELATERDAYRAMVCDLLASAYPNERDHPAMSRQWKRATELLEHGVRSSDG